MERTSPRYLSKELSWLAVWIAINPPFRRAVSYHFLPTTGPCLIKGGILVWSYARHAPIRFSPANLGYNPPTAPGGYRPPRAEFLPARSGIYIKPSFLS